MADREELAFPGRDMANLRRRSGVVSVSIHWLGGAGRIVFMLVC